MRIISIILLATVIVACEDPAPIQQTEVSNKTPAPIALPAAEFIGREACTDCHTQQVELFTGSHHDLAMQHVNAETVLGDFNNTSFTYNNITSRFFVKDGLFFVNTDGVDGVLTDFEIKYVFGFEPLQQYLIETTEGRLQALSIAWDTRTQAQGGQRWFHLYPNEKIDYKDPLHWTSRNFNWNYMCAECHSTNLKKNYDQDSDKYSTSWSEIDVSCEACHGPASNHVNLARTLDENEFSKQPGLGLITDFSASTVGQWVMSEQHPIASLNEPRKSDPLIESCARCHARRATINATYDYKKSLHDSYIISLLDEGLYHPDGQINDEVYVYGSFLQSKMYQAGVMCTDCHDPHSLKLKAEDNALCLQCHKGETYNTAEHHFHPMDSLAAQCTSCHMPAKNYMVVDPRRDHSFKIPRPDLTTKTTAPNACNGCHVDQTSTWAANIIKEKTATDVPLSHYSEAFYASRQNDPLASLSLLEVAGDASLPGIIRATAIDALAMYPGPETIRAIVSGLTSNQALIRRSSLAALVNVPMNERYRLAAGLLDDPVRSVRIEAANLLAGLNNSGLPPQQQTSLSIALQEYIESQQINNDRAFANANLGNVYMEMKQYKQAETAFKKAIALEKDFMPAHTNLAEVYRIQNQEDKAETTLVSAIAINPGFAPLHHALGLSLVRQQRYEDALTSLATAQQLSPDDAQITLVYAVALNSLEQTQEAILLLKGYLQRYPENTQIMMTLTTIYRDDDQINNALETAEQLVRLLPEDPQANALLQQLEQIKD